jgi:hypothetical protein
MQREADCRFRARVASHLADPKNPIPNEGGLSVPNRACSLQWQAGTRVVNFLAPYPMGGADRERSSLLRARCPLFVSRIVAARKFYPIAGKATLDQWRSDVRCAVEALRDDSVVVSWF